MRWMWIDRITSFEAGHRMTAVKNVSLAEEHLHDHFARDGDRPAEPVMPASLIVEGMAQTAGILVGATTRFREKVILAKIAKAIFEREVLPGDRLIYDATIDRIDAQGASCTGVVTRYPGDADPGAPGEHLADIDLLFSHVDQNRSGVEFPEENFVFSDNFRGILRAAGLEDLADAPA